MDFPYDRAMNPRFSSSAAYPESVALSSGFVAQTLWLLALAMALTVAGVFLGAVFALPILASGWVMLLFFAELGIIWTAPSWSRSSPLNIILFCLFPLFSGLTLTPLIMSVLVGYANGATILLNACISTALLSASAAVYASISKTFSPSFGTMLFQGLIGLLVFGLLQLFFPSLRGGVIEMVSSGIGIALFSFFLAYDIQRLMRRGDVSSPFLLAIGLYLDIYNLFLYVLRFIVAMSGRRR